MKHDTVVNIAGSINTMAMILLILRSFIGIELRISCWIWISILLFSIIPIISQFVKLS